MSDPSLHLCYPFAVVILLTALIPCAVAVSENLLKNPAFREGTGKNGVPMGWSLYGEGGDNLSIKLLDPDDSGRKAVLMEDGDANSEIGLLQNLPIEPGLNYQASVAVRAVEDASSNGAYLQLRFLPSDKYVQTSLAASNTKEFERVYVTGTAPPDTKSATVYLYTHRGPTPKLFLRDAELISGVSAPPSGPPEPVPPVYTKLKALHIATELVSSGKPNVTIVVPASGIYEEQAKRIQQRIEKLTGVKIPIATDESPAGVVPIIGNLIALGNRSTSKTISELYNRYYTLLDLRYPGAGGYVVRSLHNPFGDGRNVIFAGGSDTAGVDAAADALIEQLEKAPNANKSLTVGRLAAIKLGSGISVPEDLRKFETWEASAGYGSIGYFGWNSISKRMAMYYMTGNEFHAREAIRLAFPDEKARQEISDIDGERIENKDEPLSGPYHYNAHMMILFWDLIEESPVFSDEERLRVTNAFSKQLNHRKGERIYGRTTTPTAVGSRHGQWSAISLYCLGRYFQKDYPDPIWHHCVESSMLHFKPLHEHAWVSGENDNLFWYNTAIAPIFTYLTLTGDRKPIENGVIKKLLLGQEILVSGREPDGALRSASIGYLHKAAYLMQDGRYILYRQRTGVDMDVFRLGQSFWPEEHLIPKPPDDLVNKWSINALPKPMWRARNSGLKFEESFMFGSFRSAADASGDFIFIDGFNGASRNPYHTFPILELRIGGYTLLKGYRNQVFTRADGLVEPHIAMNAALKHQDVLGSTATAIGEVPDAAYCNWRRTIVQRVGQYALVVDDLTPRTDSDNMEVQIKWETERSAKAFDDGHIEFAASSESPERSTDAGGQIWTSDPMNTTLRGRVATMEWTGPVKKDEHRLFFSLLGIQPGAENGSMDCVNLSANAAAIALPSPALAVVGQFGNIKAELAIMAEDHLYCKGLEKVEMLISSTSPVDVDWDFQTSMLNVVAKSNTSVHVVGLPRLDLYPGRHVFDGTKPDSAGLKTIMDNLTVLLEQGRGKRSQAMAARLKTEPTASPLTTSMEADVGGKVVDLITIPSDTGDLICAAEGKNIHIFLPDGTEAQILKADGDIRMLRWWKEHNLLLAGCADEQVIAFDKNGNRKWVFTSEMDPAVFRAAKTYWFKSARGHEGIHGLYTGVFLDGKSQAFVGSACTLEILDENGKLIKRMPQFWGKVSHFTMVDGPNGTLNLLASRKYNGTNRVAIINNKTLNPNPRGFSSVPSGATYVGGWSSMNRHHIFYEDLDGDGAKEVISETNGTWNRMTVWSVDDKALYDASFGPGDRIPAKNMRDVDIADLDGDGKKEIVVATSAGLVVALDHQCRKIWSKRLSSPPTVMKCVTPKNEGTPWIVTGCEDGGVVVLDGEGEIVRLDKVNGSPTCIEAVNIGSSTVLLATDKGAVKAFRLE